MYIIIPTFKNAQLNNVPVFMLNIPGESLIFLKNTQNNMIPAIITPSKNSPRKATPIIGIFVSNGAITDPNVLIITCNNIEYFTEPDLSAIYAKIKPIAVAYKNW